MSENEGDDAGFEQSPPEVGAPNDQLAVLVTACACRWKYSTLRLPTGYCLHTVDLPTVQWPHCTEVPCPNAVSWASICVFAAAGGR